MQEAQYIPNWSLFEAEHIQIQLFYDEDYSLYKASLCIFLDDGENEIDYNVTISSHLVHTDKIQLAKMSFIYASTLFPNIDPVVKVWNHDVTESENIDLRKQKMTPEGYSIH